MAQLEIQSDSDEYLGALRSVRLAKTIAWLVVLLVLAIQVTCFVLAVCANLFDAPTAAAHTQPASAPAAFGMDLRHLAGWLLPVTKFAGPVAALALMVLLLAATQVSLVGRIGGAKGFSSAFVWSLILLLTMVPWQQVFGGLMGAGVLVDFNELQAAATLAKADWGKFSSAPFLSYVCRFFVWPLVALLAWLILGLRFAQGMRSVREAATVPLPREQ